MTTKRFSLDKKQIIDLMNLCLILSLITMISCKETLKQKQENYSYYESFIAHAGGQIEGCNYTNSLEALDLSYEKGCRMFELDLQLTSDNKIVAAHDPVSVTEAQFMVQPIQGKFTPINMNSINMWFEQHPDAIFVTDKINDPKLISQLFKFKDRVIMELFTWEAVEEAIALEIIPLVSETLIFGTKNIEKKLDDLKITHIGMSRLRIADNKNFLKRLKKKGIRNYVWELEAPIKEMSTEHYVWNNEMEYCYGMYANSLDILEFLLTNNDLQKH